MLLEQDESKADREEGEKKSGINYSKSPGYSEQWTRLMGGIYRSRGAPWAIAARNLV